ncbi:MAG: hypothetical protein AAF433_22380 [Bacteroidota bacterium]
MILFNREQICNHLGFGQAQLNGEATATTNIVELPENQTPTDDNEEAEATNYYTNDFINRWDDQLLDWVPIGEAHEFDSVLAYYDETAHLAEEPIELSWKDLMDIYYRLRYFGDVDMQYYAPIFPKAVKMLDGKEVIIKGFVIPVDELQGLFALSVGPYASCFFCGKASPASVISMYLRDESDRYRIDDHKTFRGTLRLNDDDPNEFYYILQNAEEV